MGISLDRIARPFVAFSERWYPDPLVFAIGLTFASFALAVAATPTTAAEALAIWGGGLGDFLAFAMQICIVLLTAHVLAHTDAVQGAIERLARWPHSAPQAYALVAALSGVASMVAGALGLVVGGLAALAVARSGARRGLALHFPLLVASGYGGFLIWHMGYSGTAPLAVATPGHGLEAVTGLIPVTETTFTGWNLGLAALTLIAVALVCSRLGPRDSAAVVALPLEEEATPGHASAPPRTPAERLDGSRALSLALGLLLVAFLVDWFRRRGFQLTLDVVNWSFLAAGLMLARSPRHYLTLVAEGSRTLGPVVLQYPLYASVVALITGTELGALVSNAFVAVATPGTLGFWAFVSGGVLNFFVPSGGGQWAIQGPIFLAAARELGVADPIVVMSVAYGDQWTNMIQPFWALPLLAIVGLDARAIMGYCFVIFLAGFVCLGGGLLWLGAG